MGLFWNDHLQSKNARRANVCDDFIYGVVNITFGDECCGGVER